MLLRKLLSILFVLLSACQLTASDVKIPYLTSECDVLSLVEGCVNAYNGKLVQVNQDITINGSDPLSFTRCYDAGHHFECELGYGVGVSFPAFMSFFWREGQPYATVELRRGLEVLFEMQKDRDKGKDCFKGTVSKKYFKSGYTNCCEALLQGESSLHAMEVEVDLSRGFVVVTLGDGTKRYYEGYRPDDEGKELTGYFFVLRTEDLPTSCYRNYSYTLVGEELALSSVKTFNNKGTLTLNALEFNYDGEKAIVSGTNGQQAHYEIPFAWGKVTRHRTWGKLKRVFANF